MAYTYRCLNKYDNALFYLKEAIYLKEKSPIAWYIYGEILFKQKNYKDAISKLNTSKGYKVKTNNLHIILCSSYFFQAIYNDDDDYYCYYYDALDNFNIALQNNPNNYLCLKYCAYNRRHIQT